MRLWNWLTRRAYFHDLKDECLPLLMRQLERNRRKGGK